MLIHSSALIFPKDSDPEWQDYCGARDGKGERYGAGMHCWTMDPEVAVDGGQVYCEHCGQSARLRDAVLCGAA